MCLATFVAAHNPLPRIPADEYGFSVNELKRDDDVRSLFTMKFVYYVQGGWCGCELGDSLDPVWEDDLDTWLRKERTELCMAFEVTEAKPEWAQDCLHEERMKGHSRRQLWKYLNAALIDNAAIEVLGGWTSGNSRPRERHTVTLEEIGLEGVKEGVLATVTAGRGQAKTPAL